MTSQIVNYNNLKINKDKMNSKYKSQNKINKNMRNN